MKKIILLSTLLLFFVNLSYGQGCVAFIKWKYGFTGSVGNAKDMGKYLSRNGWRVVSNPKYGDIAVIQPYNPSIKNGRWSGNCKGCKGYGHVGMVGGWVGSSKFNCIGASQKNGSGSLLGTKHSSLTRQYGRTITEWAISRTGVTFYRKSGSTTSNNYNKPKPKPSSRPAFRFPERITAKTNSSSAGLAWNQVRGADAYRVQISSSNRGWTKENGFTSPRVNTTRVIKRNGKVAYVFKGSSGRSYYYSVRVNIPGKGYSEFTYPQKFTIR